MDPFGWYRQLVRDLKPAQKLSIKAIEWLMDPSDAGRRSGRTWAQAVGALGAGLRNPGNVIFLMDDAVESREGALVNLVKGMVPPSSLGNFEFRSASRKPSLLVRNGVWPVLERNEDDRRKVAYRLVQSSCLRAFSEGLSEDDVQRAVDHALAEHVHTQ